MIEINFKNQPSNIGSVQQFESKEHLAQWLSDNETILSAFDHQINVELLTINPAFGTITK